MSLPTRSVHDPFEKADRHINRNTSKQDWKPAAMNQGTRSRFFKYGGVAFLLVLLFVYFRPNETSRVGEFVGGMWEET